MSEVSVSGFATFDADFPEVPVGSRATRDQDSKDLWAARRTLQTLYRAGILQGPCRLRKIPETSICATPDFELCSSLGIAFLEVTEATSGADQREMTLTESATEAVAIGAHGGRGDHGFGGDTPEKLVACDIGLAVARKATRYPTEICRRTVLGVYVNSNPGDCVHDFARLEPHVEHPQHDARHFLHVAIFKDRLELAMVVAQGGGQSCLT